MSMWRLDESLKFVRCLERALSPVGWHAALTGSVLKHGKSEKDIDVVLYPHCRTARQPRGPDSALRFALIDFGLHSVRTASWLRRQWRRRGSLDCKHVEVWATADGRRIDFMVLS